MISSTLYYILCTILSIGVLVGISMMSKVKTAVRGNMLSAVCVLLGIILTIVYNNIISSLLYILIFLLIGALVGGGLARRVKMIEMPQLVALLNGVGGLASALVGILSLCGIGITSNQYPVFIHVTSVLAILVGGVTLSGSLVAAGKLHKVLPQRPVRWSGHAVILNISLAVMALLILASAFLSGQPAFLLTLLFGSVIISLFFGYAFAIRVGGADMPITISLLNSLSGVAGAIAGMAVNDLLLVVVGGIVGASGLLLTQIMCRAMNRSLLDILTGKTFAAGKQMSKKAVTTPAPASAPVVKQPKEKTTHDILGSAKSVIIVPGYGMALAQAQHLVRQLADKLEANGAEVRYAIHPVAGRMPGHMNVLLAEADVPYEKLYELDAINDDFAKTDAVIVIGANDVMNPAARDAEDTPIYGMPVLNVDKAKEVFICNYDLKPGYAGVDNPLYSRKEGVHLLLGDAKESIQTLLNDINQPQPAPTQVETPQSTVNPLSSAKSVIIVPGYGMALAQAQHLVRQLADKLEANGAEVRYAIHPVAGRMPGHMNVLLAEADVPYEKLYEMDAINDDFAKTDAVIVIGANDVMNPAARDAEDTPIYGMPVLNVDKAKEVFICNYDLKPGYAGVDNPLYSRKEGVHLLLGDAKESIQTLLNDMNQPQAAPTQASAPQPTVNPLSSAKSVIIVPGYGMALAQAQHLVRQLADKLEANGAEVRYAIHPVAGRMPGHMNVLLAEADVPYEKLYEMDAINDDFAKTDAVIVIGANDVMNPAARDAEDTPIYGMPVLNVDKAKEVFICNYDLKPGYAGVDNPLYSRKEGVHLLLGDAKESIQTLLNDMNQPQAAPTQASAPQPTVNPLSSAKSVIIVPGYGMALAQAQHLVRQLADKLEANGAEVRYAIHPVAGRMPGHMNVLLAEADVPYEKLYEMDAINDDFAKTDAVIVIGANDVMNPAARDAEDTPIYGMPVLNVDKAKEVFICNYDLKPGYAGVDNPLYSRKEGVHLLLGDAKESLQMLMSDV